MALQTNEQDWLPLKKQKQHPLNHSIFAHFLTFVILDLFMAESHYLLHCLFVGDTFSSVRICDTSRQAVAPPRPPMVWVWSPLSLGGWGAQTAKILPGRGMGGEFGSPPTSIGAQKGLQKPVWTTVKSQESVKNAMKARMNVLTQTALLSTRTLRGGGVGGIRKAQSETWRSMMF